MKALIVEDSRLARAELKELLKAHTNIELCGEAENPRDAFPIIQSEKPELLFLDINMPGKNGFELLEALDYEPKVIFITAYTDYALQAFEFSAVDYLLKPISADRLKLAIDKLLLTKEQAAAQVVKQDLLDISHRVLLRDGEVCHWVCLQDIHYFESCANHTQVFWSGNKAVIYRALGKIEDRLPPRNFFRANRQQVLNINEVAAVEPWVNGGYKLRLKTGLEIDVSRRHAVRFKDEFSL